MKGAFYESLSNSIHEGLFVENMEKMVGFYRDVLGLEAGWDGGPYAEFNVNDDGLLYRIA